MKKLSPVRSLIYVFTFTLVAALAQAEAKKTEQAKPEKQSVKLLSGIAIVGNKEAPTSLYIVPWKNSQVGVETSLQSGFLNEDMVPVDKEVFMRELEFYDIGSKAQ